MNYIKSNIQTRFLPVLTVMLAALVTLSPFAIDSYLAAMPLMANFFGVHLSVVELTVTVYFLGFSLGNFIGGPLSDSFGRKPIALTGIVLYGLAAFLIPQCRGIEQIIALRLLQAFGGGFATVTANVFIRDWFTGKQVAKLVTVVSMMMMLAPLFAPVIGAFLIKWNGWSGVFYFMGCFATVLLVAFYFLIPESRDVQLLTKTISGHQLFAKYVQFFSDKQSVLTLFSVSFSMSGMYIFLTGASFIYIDYFKIDTDLFPLLFGANVLLNIILSFCNTILIKYYKPRFLLRTGLLVQLIAGIVLFVAVLYGTPSFWVVFIGIVVFMGSLGMVFGNGTAVILNYNPELAGSANATIGIMRFLLSFVIGSIITFFRAEDLVPLATAMFLCTLIGNVLFTIHMKTR
ncbi:multidrug effflux MFS transporter [Plebeiibacterium marinum]|uniref:Multidrug effflux MFS transporter n=1 Tax=Plebeiibacterium marinum TaxID=2992111 RepID=A0AAE3SKS9_9BACT|nr:multidrug effflux MFS transporter [Plebeiobacterium marinum]MCW3806947.1 multidrug effflux MFS transporter [Plebeiobacterium marinum]